MENILQRREGLILSAIDIINELGIQGLSIREIAKRQNITKGTFFSHFKSKSDLIIAVLNYFSQYDEVIIQSVSIKKLKGQEAIRYYVESFYTYYESYPAITSLILASDGLRCEPDFRYQVEHILLSRNKYLIHLIEEAQEANELRADIGSDCIADIIYGSCREVCLKWRIADYSFSLRTRVVYTLNAIIDSFSLRL